MDTALLILIIVIACYLLWQVFYSFWFLRNPVRQIPYGHRSIVSPADGLVKAILDVSGGKLEIDKGSAGVVITMCKDVSVECKVIVIAMNIFDVHIQRSPIRGVVEYVKHTPGSFRNALGNPRKLLAIQNEKNEILIKNAYIRLKVVQVAGFLARRIESFVKEKDVLLKGQHLGVIKMGSMALLIMPKYVNIKCQIGQHLFGGKDVVAELPKEDKDESK